MASPKKSIDEAIAKDGEKKGPADVLECMQSIAHSLEVLATSAVAAQQPTK